MRKNRFQTITRALLIGIGAYCVAYTVQSQMTTFILPTNNSDSGFKVVREDGAVVFAVDAEGTVTSDEDGLQVKLPTGDNTSSFEVISNDGTSTFKVSGDGTVAGDDSGLSVELPTNDNTSAFEVTKNNGTSVFKVSGNGGLSGDGSGLSNVRPIAAYTGGNFSMSLTGSEQVVKSVSITTPSSGIIIVSVSGYAKWGSADYDLYRLSITTNSYLDFSYLSLGTDNGQSNDESRYEPISLLRTYSMGTGGTYTFNLIGDMPTYYSQFENSVVDIEDVNMTAVYYPTGGVGAGRVALPEEDMEVQPGPGINTPDMR